MTAPQAGRATSAATEESGEQPLTRRAMRAMAAAAVVGHAATELIDDIRVERVAAPTSSAIADAVMCDVDPVELAQVTVSPSVAAQLEDTIIPELAEDDAVEIVAVEETPEATAPIAAEDEFAEAAKLFATTPIPQVSASEDVPEVPVAAETVAEDSASPDYLGSAPRKARTNFRRIATAGSSFGVMAVVGAFAVAMALPGAPVASVQQAVDFSTVVSNETVQDESAQAFVAPEDVENLDIQRSENYTAASAAQMADEYGILNYSTSLFTNDPTADIQWPFAVGTTMSYGYGMRDGRLHEGIDFTPGDGAEIQAIAAGTVRIATEDGGAYGVTVYIDHEIDGQVITSHYAHMQYGSLQVKQGDVVTPGTVVGLTGNTGRSFGAHMHFELILNGSTIDPLPWLAEHAGGYQGE